MTQVETLASYQILLKPCVSHLRHGQPGLGWWWFWKRPPSPTLDLNGLKRKGNFMVRNKTIKPMKHLHREERLSLDWPSALCMWELPIWSTSSIKTNPKTREMPMQEWSCSWPCSCFPPVLRTASTSALVSDTSATPPWPWLWWPPAEEPVKYI